MRIIGYIEHPILKITVFKMETSLSVKFERNFLEQTYKFRQHNGLEGIREIRQLVDEKFLEKVEQQFRQMEMLREFSLSKYFPSDPADEFDEII